MPSLVKFKLKSPHIGQFWKLRAARDHRQHEPDCYKCSSHNIPHLNPKSAPSGLTLLLNPVNIDRPFGVLKQSYRRHEAAQTGLSGLPEEISEYSAMFFPPQVRRTVEFSAARQQYRNTHRCPYEQYSFLLAENDRLRATRIELKMRGDGLCHCLADSQIEQLEERRRTIMPEGLVWENDAATVSVAQASDGRGYRCDICEEADDKVEMRSAIEAFDPWLVETLDVRFGQGEWELVTDVEGEGLRSWEKTRRETIISTERSKGNHYQADMMENCKLQSPFIGDTKQRKAWVEFEPEPEQATGRSSRIPSMPPMMRNISMRDALHKLKDREGHRSARVFFKDIWNDVRHRRKGQSHHKPYRASLQFDWENMASTHAFDAAHVAPS